jgi:hypothetical protein
VLRRSVETTTHSGHWLCTAATVLMVVLGPIEVLV